MKNTDETRRYRLKPNDVKAIEWTGENLSEVIEFLGDAYICASGDLVVFHHNAKFHSMSGMSLFATVGTYIFTSDGVRFDRMRKNEFEEKYELCEGENE